MSGAPLDGGHAECAIGVVSGAGVEVACGNSVEDEEKDAVRAAHGEVLEGDEAGTLELEDAEVLEGLCKQAEGVYEIAHGGLSRAMWRSLHLALQARRRRVPPPAQPLRTWSADRCTPR